MGLVGSSQAPPVQPLSALPSSQQDAAPAAALCQPLTTDTSISSVPVLDALGSHVMLPAPVAMQPLEMQPPILAAAYNSLLQSGQPTMQQLLHADEPGPQQLPHTYTSNS